MENTETLNIRISRELKQSLEKQAWEKAQTVSDLVREILETAVTQDSDNVSGIPPDLMERIRAEAQRRNIPTPLLITILLRMAVEGLRKTRGTRLVQW